MAYVNGLRSHRRAEERAWAIHNLRCQNYNHEDIARLLGISRSTVFYYCNPNKCKAGIRAGVFKKPLCPLTIITSKTLAEYRYRSEITNMK
jgi:hypothetical protein